METNSDLIESQSISSTNSNQCGPQALGSDNTESAPLLATRNGICAKLRNCLCGGGTNGGSARTLGTMSGVFAPVALSQFSTLLFLRIGFIVGSLGIYLGVTTFLLAYGILAFTILSVCAISTNGAIEGGGAYFMISRTLGAEVGGAIGVLFFAANVSSSALYVRGCVEGLLQFFGKSAGINAIANILPDTWGYEMAYGSGLNILNLLICLVGAGMFAKFTVSILIIVAICTCFVFASFWGYATEVPIPSNNALHMNETGFFTGFSKETFMSNLYPSFEVDYTTNVQIDFATVFGVLFSGVTGIMAGANMSGELKIPGRSIPRGTIYATTLTLFIYVILILLSSSTCSRFLLQNNYSFMMDINFWPPIVFIGVFTATLSASLSNLIGASRVLSALIKDNIFGKMLKWINKLSLGTNPLGAVVVSGLCVQGVLLLGQLNTIAKFTSVFFLLSYLATNLACLGLTWASAPNFRPNFKYSNIYTAAMGIMTSATMMFVISSTTAGLCIVILMILVIFLHFKSPENDWGSISQALIYHQVRKYLLLLDSRKNHVKFWRPQILLMVADPRSACPLIDFVNDLKKSGLYILGHIQVGHYDGVGDDPAAIEMPKWQALVDHLKVKAFCEVTLAPSVRDGIQQMVRVAGLGAMKPNIVILGFYDDSSRQDFLSRETTPYYVNPDQKKKSPPTHPRRHSETKNLDVVEYVTILNDLLCMKKDLVICRHFHLLDKTAILNRPSTRSDNEGPFIDVWPMNFFNPTEKDVFDQSSLFLMQLSTVLNMVSTWNKKTCLRVFVCLTDPDTSSVKKAEVEKILNDLRINANIEIVTWSDVGSHVKKPQASESSSATIDYSYLSNNYLKEVNQLIRGRSVNTAVTFLFLPRPPSNQNHYGDYLNALTLLTDLLHPTILVHGVSHVTTTNL